MKKSDYGLQLEEQQKLKAIYGMLTRKQMVKYYHNALKSKENTPQVFLQQFECRLDNIVYKLRFAPTIFAAQQLVAHGHVLVNGKKVDRRSFQVTAGMEISIKSKARDMEIIKQSLANTSREVPSYLELDADRFSGRLLSIPEIDQISLPIPLNIPLVCEHLAHSS